MEEGLKKHKHNFIGGMCDICTDEETFILPESEVNDEEVTRYKKFGVG